MPDETEGIRIFKRYSKDACDLENKLHFAQEKCGFCVPWNIPIMSLLVPENVPTRFCDAFEHRCMWDAITDLKVTSIEVNSIFIPQDKTKGSHLEV